MDESISTADLAELESQLLRAATRREPLPGATRAVVLPDLAFAEREEEVAVAREAAEPTLAAEGLPKPLHVASEDELRGLAVARQRDLAYFAFDVAEPAEDLVLLTLSLRLAPADPSARSLGLGGIQATFRHTGQGWRATGDTAALAT
jgi:hypothetical protein